MTRTLALSGRARRYLADAARGFEHAPVEVTLSLLLAVAFSWAVEAEGDAFRTWLELAVIAALAGGLAFTATLLHALGVLSRRNRWLLTIGGTIAAALYGATLLNLELAAEAWRAAMLVAAATLLVLGAPALGARRAHEDLPVDATERFRMVTGRLLLRTLAVTIYAAALFAGLALAVGAVNTLFELQLDTKIYAHVFGWISLVLVTWVVMGGVPDYAAAARSDAVVAGAVHRLSAYLVVPLLAIYYVILYAYAVRIGMTGELPKNLVSPLVIAAGIIAAVALILFDPRPDDRSPLRTLPLAALLFVPLSILGLWALSMRFGQYGWTEFRALRTVWLCALGTAAVGGTILHLRQRRLPLHVLPLGLAAVLTLAVVGPWSVIALSRADQQARLAEALASAGIAPDAIAVTDTIVSNETYESINSIAHYLLSHHGGSALPPLLAQYARRENGYYRHAIAHDAGLRRADGPLQSPRRLFAHLPDGAAFGAADGRVLHYVRVESGDRTQDAVTTPSGQLDSLVLHIRIADVPLTADLEPLLRRVAAGRMDDPLLSPQHARIPVFDDTGVERGELIVLEVAFGGTTGTRVARLVGMVQLTRP